MNKALSFLASASILCGCASHRKSAVWQQVVDAPRVSPPAANTSDAYAKGLHSTLQKSGVEHKVVTYNYPFHSKFDGAGTAQRTSVIYRDSASPKYPWWIMDERLSRPVWLPSEPVQKQVSFFLRRPVKVVTLREYAGGDGKSVASLPAPKPEIRVARVEPPKVSVPEASVVEAPRRPYLVTRIWRATKAFFRNDDTTPVPTVSVAATPVVVAKTRIEPPTESVSAPMIAEGPKRALFRPSGVKLRPLFSRE